MMTIKLGRYFSIPLVLLICGVRGVPVDGAICSAVVMQVQQEATLVRQGFDAHMHIDNALPVALSDLSVKVIITDAEGNSVLQTSDPDSQIAEFFVRVDQTEGVNLSSGATVVSNGSVTASSSADLNWLIIPTLNANVTNQYGEVFYVGAELSYTVDGEPTVLSVTPDSIVVKPLPELALDYFMPQVVYGDDPGTGIIEPSESFSLGVMVRNEGYGPAKSMKISSSQPKIIDNIQHLLVGFKILGTEVNGKTAANSLLVDFGTVEPGATTLARWKMICSMYGEFVAFRADFSHADELGGMVTSLIQSNNIQDHVLLRDVLVDLPGRDSIRDFLTDDLKLYESDGLITEVTNLTDIATLAATNDFFVLQNLPELLAGPAYFSTPISDANRHVLNHIVRSDGRPMRSENVWVSKWRESSESAWEYTLHVFDADPLGAGRYQVYFDEPEVVSNAVPELVGDSQVAYVNRTLQFSIYAHDPDNTIPELGVSQKPAEASFMDFANGYGYFSWTPSVADVGTTVVTFTAADAYDSTNMNVTITVRDGSVPTNYPTWWYDYDVITTNATANDFAAVNQGQLKNIAWAAYREMQKLYGGTNGTGGALFELAGTNNVYNYRPVNIGQAKALATNFYDRLHMDYPWTGSSNPTNDFAMANIGQVKNLFSFEPLKDSDGDGMPDWWEDCYGNGSDLLPDGDENGDGTSNLDAYYGNIAP